MVSFLIRKKKKKLFFRESVLLKRHLRIFLQFSHQDLMCEVDFSKIALLHLRHCPQVALLCFKFHKGTASSTDAVGWQLLENNGVMSVCS